MPEGSGRSKMRRALSVGFSGDSSKGLRAARYPLAAIQSRGALRTSFSPSWPAARVPSGRSTRGLSGTVPRLIFGRSPRVFRLSNDTHFITPSPPVFSVGKGDHVWDESQRPLTAPELARGNDVSVSRIRGILKRNRIEPCATVGRTKLYGPWQIRQVNEVLHPDIYPAHVQIVQA